MMSAVPTKTVSVASQNSPSAQRSPITRRSPCAQQSPIARRSSTAGPFTPDKSGSTMSVTSLKKKFIAKNLFHIKKAESREAIEKGVFPLKHYASECPYRLQLEEKRSEWKQDITKRDNEVKKLQRELKEVTEEKNILQKQLNDNLKIVEAVNVLFTQGQIRSLMSGSNVKWSPEDISSAISLRSVSAKAYRYLKYHCHFPLPSLSTLRRWAATFDVRPGHLKNVAKLMQQKAKDLSVIERLTAISFDEMFIKSQICLEKKYETVFGSNRTVQVMTARGLCSNWKQPVYYDFDQAVTKNILEEAIATLHNSNYIVVAMVSDMGSTNQRLWKDLGIDTSKNTFTHPCDESKLRIVFADVPHL